MKKKITISKNIIFIILLFLIIINRKTTTNAITIGINLWVNQLLPSIFPTLIIGKTLISNLNIPSIIMDVFNHLLKFNGNSLILILLALIVGSPTSQIFFKDALIHHKISYQNYRKLLISTSIINPLFFWNIVTYLDNKTKVVILITNYLITIILWLTIKNDNYHSLKSNSRDSFLNIITDSFKVMLNILSIILFFNVLINIITIYLKSNLLKIFLTNLEITNGYVFLSNLSLNYRLLVILTAFLTTFMGLCINYQIKSIINDNTLYNTYIKFTLVRGTIVALISYVFT